MEVVKRDLDFSVGSEQPPFEGVVGRELTAPAMNSLLAVIKQKDGDDEEGEIDTMKQGEVIILL